MRDTNTGRSRGFGFLTFADPESVTKVVNKTHILDGKVIDPKKAIGKDEQERSGKVFVGGIAPDVTPEEFKEYFAKFGPIVDSQLMLDKDTGKSRGYGFVTYESMDSVEIVTQNKYVMFHGKQMEIKKAEPRAVHNRNVQQQQHQQNQLPQVGGMNPMMGGFYQQGNMGQYWQQMQQLQQQYWMQMQQMQQMQQPQPGGNAAGPSTGSNNTPLGNNSYGGNTPTGYQSGSNGGDNGTGNQYGDDDYNNGGDYVAIWSKEYERKT
ncbi:unnamed protein product [Ambrosiozyma monospora]|uniref:Unnamed protein product n=1 Tax=Ambrosiozyma monospora TaxID=43982 RepID=A0ACB5UE22_AMBMO|nr:unnamed protein product [Ambrosiozyma monospora]